MVMMLRELTGILATIAEQILLALDHAVSEVYEPVSKTTHSCGGSVREGRNLPTRRNVFTKVFCQPITYRRYFG
jgi:hypothetical protein